MKTFFKTILLILAVLSFQSCEMMIDMLVEDEDWTVNVDGVQTKDDVFARTATIQYVYSDKWPTAPVTDATRIGDCKGYSILAIQMFEQLGYDAKFVVANVSQPGGLGENIGHAMVYVNGAIYEPQAPDGNVPADMVINSYELWSYEKLRRHVKAEHYYGRSVQSDKEFQHLELH